MKFKIGDKVRLTREATASKEDRNYRVFEFEVIGVEVIGIKDNLVSYKYKDRCYGNEYEANLELVPEKPEFERGEYVEVKAGYGIHVKRIFFDTYISNGKKYYLCVSPSYEESFNSGEPFNLYSYQEARKLKPQLTRKEIAEKFGVSEDFTLVD